MTQEERLLAIEKESFTPDTEAGNQARGQPAHYAGAAQPAVPPLLVFRRRPR